MRRAEADWIGGVVAALQNSQISPCINIGSSTGAFRTEKQPHIDRLIFSPLHQREVQVVHVDMKSGEGIDLVGDILSPAFQQQIISLSPRLTILSNVLEHVTDRAALVAACNEIVAPGRHLIVTVPYSYPFHADPIDTGFRPTPDELLLLFPDFDCIDSRIIVDTTYWKEICDNHHGMDFVFFIGRMIVRCFVPFYRPAVWLGVLHRFLWLARPFKVTALLLRRRLR